MLRQIVTIVRGRYYEQIIDQLSLGVTETLTSENTKWEIRDVSGVWELAQAIRHLYEGEGKDIFIALGCVVKGETGHYEHLSSSVFDGLMKLSMRSGIILINGVLTVPNLGLAEERSDVHRKNKGREAALACLKMIDLIKS